MSQQDIENEIRVFLMAKRGLSLSLRQLIKSSWVVAYHHVTHCPGYVLVCDWLVRVRDLYPGNTGLTLVSHVSGGRVIFYFVASLPRTYLLTLHPRRPIANIRVTSVS